MADRSFDLVIFDNDGVLVDSEPIAADVLAGLLEEEGLQMTRGEVMNEFIGSSMARVREATEAHLARPLPPDFEDRYYRRLFERFRRELRPVDGVRDVIERIALPKCVASSGSQERIRLTLDLTGLWSEFEGAAFSVEEVTRGKPAPDLFLYAAERMGVRAEHCAVIEDSPRGVEAAAAAGMTCFGFAARTPPERLAGASGGIFQEMRQLPDLLGRGRPG